MHRSGFCFSPFERVERTLYACARLLHDVGIDLHRFDGIVAEQLLDGAYVHAGFQQVCCAAVPERVTAGWLRNIGCCQNSFHCFLQRVFVQVMPAPDQGAWIDPEVLRRENPLPTPFLAGVRIFHAQRIRQSLTSQEVFDPQFGDPRLGGAIGRERCGIVLLGVFHDAEIPRHFVQKSFFLPPGQIRAFFVSLTRMGRSALMHSSFCAGMPRKLAATFEEICSP